ncbi:MAG: DUF2220 domain-containing protein [Spirochaetaceae bacterium]|nr:DUF2220 domain-containing protein [Spirochaetaceae bacterium]
MFPGFATASPDEKESFLEALESLAGDNVIRVKWQKHRVGEEPLSVTCTDFDKLLTMTGKAKPQDLIDEVSSAAKEIVNQHIAPDFFNFIYTHINISDIMSGMNTNAIYDISAVFVYMQKHNTLPAIRALSILLYNDSKRLEELLSLFQPLFRKAEKAGIVLPDMTGLERSFPEVWFAGRIKLTANGANHANIMENSNGIIGLSLSTVNQIDRITPLPLREGFSILTVENKETFYALSQGAINSAPTDLFPALYVYTAGYPNRAVSAFIKKLAAQGCTVYHTGDLDPDGILILQDLCAIIGRAVLPYRMDTKTFNHYKQWGRPLEDTQLKRLALIKDETKNLPGIAALCNIIAQSGLGVEQEIINYEQ